MNGDLRWFGRSGVPGLGVSVENHYQYVPALQLWDEDSTDHEQPGQPRVGHQSLGDRLVSILGIRRRNTVKETGVKVPVRRSQSMVTTLRNKKLGSIRDNDTQDQPIHPATKLNQSPGSKTNTDSDKQIYCDQNINTLTAVSMLPVKQSIVCQNCLSQGPLARPNVPPSVRRTASYHHQRGRKEIKKQSLQRSGTVLIQGPPPSHAINAKVPRLPKPSTKPERREETGRDKKSLKQLSTTATQTENQYDYAYSSSVTPAMMIGVPSDKEEDCSTNNIYEEILPPDKRLFYSISQARRDNLEMYKFADWDLEEKLKQPTTDKDNYIKPKEIKSSLNKKSSLRKLKTKEPRNVTFAGDQEEPLKRITIQRSKSVNVSSHNPSKHN